MVAKLNNTIQKNKRNQEYIPIHDQIVIFRPVARPIHYPLLTHNTKNSRYLSPQGLSGQKRSAFKPVGLSGYRQEWSEAELL